MAYDYASRRVWLSDPVAPIPHGAYALCERHASSLTTPVNWVLTDARERPPELPLVYGAA